MAHFAEVDDNDIVLRVIVVNNDVLIDENGLENEMLGKEFCTNLLGGEWIQTSFNGNFRGNFAGIGSKYNRQIDVFENANG